MKQKRCIVCRAPVKKGKLCSRCTKSYIWEPKLKGVRLRKVLKNARLRKKYNWKNEKRLYSILRKLYKTVHRDFRPEWSLSPKGAALEYDLCVPSKKILIEIDGPYHWNKDLYKTEEAFQYRLLCDRIKEERAEENGWEFIRIDLELTTITIKTVYEMLGLKYKRRVRTIRRI